MHNVHLRTPRMQLCLKRMITITIMLMMMGEIRRTNLTQLTQPWKDIKDAVVPDENDYIHNDVDEDLSNTEEQSYSNYSYAEQPLEDIKDADLPDENDYNYNDVDEDGRNKEYISNIIYSYS